MTQLNRYTLLERIGSSTLGAVYKAQNTVNGSLVALKVLQLGLLDDVSSSEMDGRLQRDYDAAVRLQHPGIARVFEIRRDGRTALIASELVEGPPITSLTNTTSGSDLSQVVAATVQLLDALEFAHNQLVIHRDLKPSNVLIKDGRIKITDFGMVDLGARNRMDTGTLVGDTEYMAPEQFLSGTIDKRCDIHAVGTILYELLTGKSPFRGDLHTAAAMFKVLELVPPPPSQVRHGLSPVFDSLVGRALAKKAEQRFLNARLFRNELCAAYTGLTGRAPPETIGPVAAAPPPAPRQDTSRATIVQSRASLDMPRGRSHDTPTLDRAFVEMAPRHDTVRTSPPPREEPTAPLSPAPAPAIAAPANARAAPADASFRSSDLAARPVPASTAPSAAALMRAVEEMPRAQWEAVKESTAATPPAAQPPAAEPLAARGSSLRSQEIRCETGSSDLIRVEPRPSEPPKPSSVQGGTVLARPKFAVVEQPAAPQPAATAPETHRNETLLEAVPPLPKRGSDVAIKRQFSGGTVSAPSSEEQLSAAAAPTPVPPDLLPAARAPISHQPLSPSEGGPGEIPVEARPREILPPPVEDTPVLRTRASSLPPKRLIPLTDESIAHGGRVLAQFIGPIALVFSRRAAQDTHDERGYLDMLAAHLSDPDERAQFFRKVRQRPV